MKTNSMFIVTLKFSENKGRAHELMQGHNEWINDGIKDDVFLMVGSLKFNLGGVIVAYNSTFSDIQVRVEKDPFVIENIVSFEIIEFTPAKLNNRLDFLFR
ncbi:YciI family protein [Tenacibaculum sp.]|uniref:YciI family protein n=1 Tax=Tenacibaculum sp. TaxID=1906242 RepID=UPI003D09A6B7